MGDRERGLVSTIVLEWRPVEPLRRRLSRRTGGAHGADRSPHRDEPEKRSCLPERTRQRVLFSIGQAFRGAGSKV